MRRLLARLTAFVRSNRAERELTRELASHVALLEDEYRRQGMTADRARAAALKTLGGLDQAKERHRDERSVAWLEDLRRDLPYALRQLRREPATAVIGVLSLALGIGAVTPVVSTIETVVLSPYPYADVERLAVMEYTDRTGRVHPMATSIEGFSDLLKAHALEDGVLWEIYPTATGRDGERESITAGWLTPNAFRFFGVPPLVGTTFAGDIAHLTSGPEQPVVLSERYWRHRFGASPDVLGTSLELDGRSYTIVGVMPDRFRLFNGEIYIPIPPDTGPYFPFVRLKSGVTRDAAAAELSAIFQQRAQKNGRPNWRDLRVVLTDMREHATAHLTRVLGMLAAAVGLLLLIGCANLSILLMSRGIARRHELTMRQALGASNGRLFRQLLTESLLYATIAGVLGVAFAYALLPVIVYLMPSDVMPQDVQMAINAKVLAFTVLVAILSGVLAGLSPSLHFSRPRLNPTSRGEVVGTRERRLHSLHVLGQVAVTVLLLAGSAAALRTFVSLTRAELGYDPTNTVSVHFMLARGAFPTWAERNAYYERIRAAVATVPGVTAVAIALQGLPPRAPGRTGIEIVGGTTPTLENVVMERVSDEYFSTLRIPLARGRIWTPSEAAAAVHVAVVNETMARSYWPNESPLGKRIDVKALRKYASYETEPPNHSQIVEVIGVVRDARNNGLRDAALPAVYVPYTLLTWDAVTFLVRGRGAPSAIIRAAEQRIAEINPSQPVNKSQTMDERLRSEGWARQQFVASLFLLCAGTALFLAAIGLYSVVACAVSERRRELAVRVALGASRGRVVGAVLRTTAFTVLLGVVCGALLTMVLDRPLVRWTETSLWSVASLAQVIAVPIVAGGCAVLVPVRRALSLDPMAILRGE